jgi:hypothetical protein
VIPPRDPALILEDRSWTIDRTEDSMKDVYAIYESKTDGRERSRWVRVGVAFDNKDGSLNVLLDALPLSGRLQIRQREVESDPSGNGSAGSSRERA